MKTRSQYHALGLALCACLTLQSAHAVSTITQTFDFGGQFTEVNTTPGSFHRYDYPAFFSASVTPFNTTLGTLESVTVLWTYSSSFQGLTGSAPAGGEASVSIGGTFYIGNSGYDGNGTGGSNGAASDTSFTFTTETIADQTEFTAAKAGVSQDPAIWAAVTGNSSYAAKWALSGTNNGLQYINLASGTLDTDLTLDVTYHYTPSPVPEPASVLGSIALLSGGMFFRRRKLAA